MRNTITLLFILFLVSKQFTFAQGVNNITIKPSNPSSNDTIIVISDFSYYGNCSYALVNSQIDTLGFVINIYPEYCGFGDSTLCSSIDTFSIGILAVGNYTINIEYHQGSVCPISSFDSIIAFIDTSIYIGALSTNSITSNNHDIIIYPNPSSNFINIKSNKHIKSINLFDISGKEISFLFNDNNLDMSLIRPGFYILIIELNNGKRIKKEIIKKNTP